MRIITTREITRQTRTYFEMAETERVAVKRGNKYINMIVTDTPDSTFINENWLKDFFVIPEKYRCNPFDYSPSGDLFYADKRNIERLNKSIEQARSGKVKRLSRKEQKELFDIQ